MSPNESVGCPAAYLGAAGGDALTRSSQRFSVTEGKEERRIYGVQLPGGRIGRRSTELYADADR
jgi:hypothetical protein